MSLMRTVTPQEIKQAIKTSAYPVALTGAGISVASSLPTLNKKFHGIPIETILHRSFFEEHPYTFYEFYREILRWKYCDPNPAHYTLAKYGISTVTQNIDGLHQKAGSQKVIEIHGNLRHLRCEQCCILYNTQLAKSQTLPLCHACGSILKPDIVLYNEPIQHWKKAVKEFLKADLVLIVGTSLQSSPINALPQLALESGAAQITINVHSDQFLHF